MSPDNAQVTPEAARAGGKDSSQADRYCGRCGHRLGRRHVAVYAGVVAGALAVVLITITIVNSVVANARYSERLKPIFRFAEALETRICLIVDSSRYYSRQKLPGLKDSQRRALGLAYLDEMKDLRGYQYLLCDLVSQTEPPPNRADAHAKLYQAFAQGNLRIDLWIEAKESLQIGNDVQRLWNREKDAAGRYQKGIASYLRTRPWQSRTK
jgi:hypothetical protein